MNLSFAVDWKRVLFWVRLFALIYMAPTEGDWFARLSASIW